MNRVTWLRLVGWVVPVGLLAMLLSGAAAGQAQEPGRARASRVNDPEVKEAIHLGLEWLARNQHPDGHWEANNGQYPTSMTALAGMAMLMEGSTLREGRYAERINKAVEWFLKRSQPNGLLGNPNNPTEAQRYMYGHGFGLLFLASVYGEEKDGPAGKAVRDKLEDLLTRAVKFCGNAQTDRGGWGYVSALEGNNFDEGSVTITQLQALRAAKNAGIVVPKTIIDKSIKYLRDSTTPKGGVIYSLAHGSAGVGQERPPLTAAAIACSFSAGQYKSEDAKKWIAYCKDSIYKSVVGTGRPVGGHDEYQSYYFAQAMYVMGDNMYKELFPNSPANDQMRWTEYRDKMYEFILKSQNRGEGRDKGSWNGGYIGQVFSTSVNLCILQLERNTLPIYAR
jgi:hypothetical protein